MFNFYNDLEGCHSFNKQVTNGFLLLLRPWQQKVRHPPERRGSFIHGTLWALPRPAGVRPQSSDLLPCGWVSLKMGFVYGPSLRWGLFAEVRFLAWLLISMIIFCFRLWVFVESSIWTETTYKHLQLQTTDIKQQWEKQKYLWDGKTLQNQSKVSR